MKMLFQKNQPFNNSMISPFIFVFFFIQYFSISALAVPKYITLQTRIYKPDTTPLQAPSVTFQITTLDSVGTCVLYVENYSGISMTASGGSTVLNLGLGVQIYTSVGANYTDVFNNQTASFACQGGGTYTPAVNDRRKIVLQFNDGTAAGWQTAQ
ncbi:MAG: hypothetical protein H7061_11875, partial [Bdellovibrionaceae bacterium]|nr:hypothetical protein [Bdellovibrio sp.]